MVELHPSGRKDTGCGYLKLLLSINQFWARAQCNIYNYVIVKKKNSLAVKMSRSTSFRIERK